MGEIKITRVCNKNKEKEMERNDVQDEVRYSDGKETEISVKVKIATGQISEKEPGQGGCKGHGSDWRTSALTES